MNAHNHGPEDGLGRACPERHVNGTQVGVCVLTNGASILAAAGLCNASEERGTPDHDPVKRPSHYTSHPSGVECLDIIEHYPFNIGAAMKYLWRAGLKGDAIEDLEKASQMIRREIERLSRSQR